MEAQPGRTSELMARKRRARREALTTLQAGMQVDVFNVEGKYLGSATLEKVDGGTVTLDRRLPGVGVGSSMVVGLPKLHS